MGRLTKEFTSCEYCEDMDCTGYKNSCMHRKVYEKLAHYEDLEEQGRLKELPFKLGDKVYTNLSMQGWYMQKKKRPYEAKIVFIGINGIDDIFNVELGEGKMLGFRFSDIGKNVFLTKEEAEAKLKEMKGDVK